MKLSRGRALSCARNREREGERKRGKKDKQQSNALKVGGQNEQISAGQRREEELESGLLKSGRYMYMYACMYTSPSSSSF